MTKALLFFDGGGKNPGIMKLSICLKIDGYDSIISDWVDTETYGTNNQAEWLALIWGIIEAKKHNVTELTVYGDSQVVVYCASGFWNTKNPQLKELKEMFCSELFGQNMDVKINWLPRDNNPAGWQISDVSTDRKRLEKWLTENKMAIPRYVHVEEKTNYTDSDRIDYTKIRFRA